MSARSLTGLALLIALLLAGCGGGGHHSTSTSTLRRSSPTPPPSPAPSAATGAHPANVYAADATGGLAPAVQGDRSLIYVPNSAGNSVDEIDPHTDRIVRHFAVGTLPQHVVPAWDLRTLYVTNDEGNSLTPINPRNGVPGKAIPVTDPYNLYFTPDGRYAVVMAERLRRIDFRDAHTMALRHSLAVPTCAGVNHADYTADGRYMLVTCEFASALVVVDVAHQRLVTTIHLPAGSSAQDVKLAPDGRVFYVADLFHAGVYTVIPGSWRVTGRIHTGAGAHGLYPSRNDRFLYISNRSAGTVSVLSFATRRVVRTWALPGGGSPDMGNVSADGRVLWLSGRYNGVVYAISTRSGRLLAKVPVGSAPHGLCVWPQPGRYSLGHTGILR